MEGLEVCVRRGRGEAAREVARAGRRWQASARTQAWADVTRTGTCAEPVRLPERAIRRWPGGSAALACGATVAKAAACVTAMSASILRSSSTAGGLQAAHQLRVGEPVLARGGVDADDPQAAEVALLVLAADVGVLAPPCRPIPWLRDTACSWSG